MHLIESDPALSRPITDDPSASSPGAGDWFALIDGTDVNAVSAVLAARAGDSAVIKSAVISTGIYRLMWDLAKSDIPLSQINASNPTAAYVAVPHKAAMTLTL